jgi:hypothetical protein
MVSKTRKVSKGQKNNIHTVPELRRAFEHIDKFVERKIMRLSEKEGVAAFRKEWKKVFGQISEQSAKDYLQVMRNGAKRSQKGGAVTILSPAAIGYEMRAGEGGPSVPPYVTRGLELPADSQIGPSRAADFPVPADSTGSNAVQAGGRRRKTRSKKSKRQQGGALPSFGTALAEFVSRPFGMGAPPSPSQDAQMLMKGYNQFSSPRPEINDLSMVKGTTIYNATISPVSKMF